MNTAFVTLSDLHVGSEVAIWPPGFHTEDKGRYVPQTRLQKEWFWKLWVEELPGAIVELSPEAERRILVINGDVTEGIHHGTTEVMVNTRVDMFKALKMVLEPLRGLFDGYLLTKGTECHSGLDEIGIGHYLGAQSVQDKLHVRHNGIMMIWRHHMPTTKRIHTEGNALMMEMSGEIAEAARCGRDVPKVLTMAHRHVPSLHQSGTEIVGVTGAWQDLTRFGHKVVGHAVCKPSVMVYDFTGRGKGELPNAQHRAWVPKMDKQEIIEI